ncbi:MAG: hypothetical protein ACFE8M_12975 [Candidatus Hermodarchaeota archaeon]
MLIDKAKLLDLTEPEITVLIGGLPVYNRKKISIKKFNLILLLRTIPNYTFY